MNARRVFISSVFGDFAAERSAARAALENLRQIPVMAEDFGAKPASPQAACLEGVRSSDIYIGIFGHRHGFVGQSGVSATEEEFNEARRQGLDILCFVQNVEKEAQQDAFLERVKSFEVGHHVAFFDTPVDLKDKVVRALHDLIGEPNVRTLDAAGATSHMQTYLWGSQNPRHQRSWLGLVIFPARQGDVYLSPLDLGKKHVHEKLLQPAMFGPSALFRRELGVGTREGSDWLAFVQPAPPSREEISRLNFHTDGTLVYGAQLADEGKQHSLIRGFTIDQDEVQQRLEQFCNYARCFYEQLERSAAIQSLYCGLSLTGLSQKMFGRLPKPEPHSFTMPAHRLADPLCVPNSPYKLARSDLAKALEVATNVTELCARMFRAENAYFQDPE